MPSLCAESAVLIFGHTIHIPPYNLLRGNLMVEKPKQLDQVATLEGFASGHSRPVGYYSCVQGGGKVALVRVISTFTRKI